MNKFISNFKRLGFPPILFLIFFLYFAFGSSLSIYRYKTYLTAHFDLSTMHQPTYNTYMAIKTGEFDRILEMTDPHESRGQISRLSYHFDPILIPISLFYFIHSGPETLFVLRAFFLALAMFPLYKLGGVAFSGHRDKNKFSLFFCLVYAFYFPIAVNFIHSFHPVDLAPFMLLSMIYYALKRNYLYSLVFFFFALLLKENVPLSTMMFGITLLLHFKFTNIKILKKDLAFALFLIVFSPIWFYIVMEYIIPFYRGGNQSYYIGYYSHLGDTPRGIILGFFTRPQVILEQLISPGVVAYGFMLGLPLLWAFLFSPVFLLSVLPEFAINALSKSELMRYAAGQYDLVLAPFLFAASLFGFRTLINRVVTSSIIQKKLMAGLIVTSIVSLVTSYSLIEDHISHYMYIKTYQPNNELQKDLNTWKEKLASDDIKISSTPMLSPHFSSRRYLYLFDPWYESIYYEDADYVLILTSELKLELAQEHFTEEGRNKRKALYKKLTRDPRFELIHSSNGFEVFQRIES